MYYVWAMYIEMQQYKRVFIIVTIPHEVLGEEGDQTLCTLDSIPANNTTKKEKKENFSKVERGHRDFLISLLMWQPSENYTGFHASSRGSNTISSLV